MNPIHSSSLAFYPVAYKKPQSGRIDGGETAAVNAGNSNPGRQRSDFNQHPSTPEQIKAALSNAGLADGDIYSQPPYNTRTQKALNAYTQNHNQTTRLQVAESISGIDLYA